MTRGSQLRAQQRSLEEFFRSETPKVVNKYNRIRRIQRLCYPRLLRVVTADQLPVPPSVLFPNTTNGWTREYQVWRDAVIIMVLLECPEPPAEATITDLKEYRRHTAMMRRTVRCQDWAGLVCGFQLPGVLFWCFLPNSESPAPPQIAAARPAHQL